MLKDLIAQRNALDEEIKKTRRKEGKSEIKRVVKTYALSPAYLRKLADRVEQKRKLYK